MKCNQIILFYVITFWIEWDSKPFLRLFCCVRINTSDEQKSAYTIDCLYIHLVSQKKLDFTFYLPRGIKNCIVSWDFLFRCVLCIFLTLWFTCKCCSLFLLTLSASSSLCHRMEILIKDFLSDSPHITSSRRCRLHESFNFFP